MARKKTRDAVLTEQSLAFADFASKAIAAAKLLGITKKPLATFPLDHAEQLIAAGLPVQSSLKKKLAKLTDKVTIAETAEILKVIANSLKEGSPLQLLVLLFMSKKLVDCLRDNIEGAAPPAKSKKPKSSGTLFQFKVTLLESTPPIWRRIQVMDCTLDKLHEHIQTAMGWTNSHLHQFEINGQRYGDPELLDDGFEDFECIDSTATILSEILPKTGKPFSLIYEYDFGDGWDHEVLFEGCPTVEPKAKYPRCLEGERACPPEDIGGIGGYEEFLEAIQDSANERHEELREWIGGSFDPDAFDVKAATKSMKKGLPDWRNQELI